MGMMSAGALGLIIAAACTSPDGPSMADASVKGVSASYRLAACVSGLSAEDGIPPCLGYSVPSGNGTVDSVKVVFAHNASVDWTVWNSWTTDGCYLSGNH